MQLLTINDLVLKLKINKNEIYRLVKLGKFPKPIILQVNKYRWHEDTIKNWIQNFNK